MDEYNCPYCPRKSLSPGGVRFHVKLTHPDKLAEFDEKYFKEMTNKFNAKKPKE